MARHQALIARVFGRVAGQFWGAAPAASLVDVSRDVLTGHPASDAPDATVGS